MVQMHLRLPPALHAHLEALAQEQGYGSLNGFLVMLLAGASSFTLGEPVPGGKPSVLPESVWGGQVGS